MNHAAIIEIVERHILAAEPRLNSAARTSTPVLIALEAIHAKDIARDVLALADKRVSELLAHNSELLERARAAEATAEGHLQALIALLRHFNRLADELLAARAVVKS